ncbi:MAG: hypothetical protein BGO11_15800 [Solirubrobacterales bacterium 70-9]|nr:MAG: hypothetical protein BGO11_15800 [Solirubrobacterales bacterium 70-9]
MRLRLVPILALLVLGLAVAAAQTAAAPKGGKKVHCKKGQIRKHKHGEWVCVAKPAKPTPHPGLDVLGTPGTYVGSNGVTVTSSTTAEGSPQISMTIAFPPGYVSCKGRPPYPSLKIAVADMLVSGYGEFGGSSSAAGAYASIEGHFTGPNTLTLESASASNVLVQGERCAAQYTNASVIF